jgi:hypothetical protein
VAEEDEEEPGGPDGEEGVEEGGEDGVDLGGGEDGEEAEGLNAAVLEAKTEEQAAAATPPVSAVSTPVVFRAAGSRSSPAGTEGEAEAIARVSYPTATGLGIDENARDNPFGSLAPTPRPARQHASRPHHQPSSGEVSGRLHALSPGEAPAVRRQPSASDTTEGRRRASTASEDRVSVRSRVGSTTGDGAPGTPTLPTSTKGSAPVVGPDGWPLPVPSASSLHSGLWSTPSFGCTLRLSPSDMLRSDVKSDIVHTFTDGSEGSRVSFSVTSPWAVQFHGLRELAVDSQRSFVQSLAFAERWDTTGGKSGARFERTSDDRFVIKHVSKTEYDMFVTAIAPSYFSHMHATLTKGAPSVLVRIVGAHKIVVAARDDVSSITASLGAFAGLGGSTGSSDGVPSAPVRLTRAPSYVLVMENLFGSRVPIPHGLKFDLKGKVRSLAGARPAGSSSQGARPPLVPSGVGGSRLPPGSSGVAGTPPSGGSSSSPGGPVGSDEGANPFAASSPLPHFAPPGGGGIEGGGSGVRREGPVLLDADLLAHTKGQALPLTDEGKRWLASALFRDTKFLTGATIIDYSILIGIARPGVAAAGPGLGGVPVALVGAGPSVNYGGDEVVVGIIDFVRRFDIVKRLENRVKTVVNAGAEPTVVQPERYARRLLRAANQYFAFVPTRWSVLPIPAFSGAPKPRGWAGRHDGSDPEGEEEEADGTDGAPGLDLGAWGGSTGTAGGDAAGSAVGGAAALGGQGSGSGGALYSGPGARYVPAVGLPPPMAPHTCPPLPGAPLGGFYTLSGPSWALPLPDVRSGV